MGPLQVARPQGRRQAEGRTIGVAHHFFLRAKRRNRHHRAENLFLIDPAADVQIHDHRGLEEGARLTAFAELGGRGNAAAAQDMAPLLPGQVDVALDPFQVTVGYEGA